MAELEPRESARIALYDDVDDGAVPCVATPGPRGGLRRPRALPASPSQRAHNSHAKFARGAGGGRARGDRERPTRRFRVRQTAGPGRELGPVRAPGAHVVCRWHPGLV